MATIRVTIVFDKTVATLNAATIDAVLQWVDTNIRQKIPADVSMTVQLNVTP